MSLSESGLKVSSAFDRESKSGTDYKVIVEALQWPDDRSCICPTNGWTQISFSEIREKSTPFSIVAKFNEKDGCGEPEITVPELDSFCEEHGCNSKAAFSVVSKVLSGFCN